MFGDPLPTSRPSVGSVVLVRQRFFNLILSVALPAIIIVNCCWRLGKDLWLPNPLHKVKKNVKTVKLHIKSNLGHQGLVQGVNKLLKVINNMV